MWGFFKRRTFRCVCSLCAGIHRPPHRGQTASELIDRSRAFIPQSQSHRGFGGVGIVSSKQAKAPSTKQQLGTPMVGRAKAERARPRPPPAWVRSAEEDSVRSRRFGSLFCVGGTCVGASRTAIPTTTIRRQTGRQAGKRTRGQGRLTRAGAAASQQHHTIIGFASSSSSSCVLWGTPIIRTPHPRRRRNRTHHTRGSRRIPIDRLGVRSIWPRLCCERWGRMRPPRLWMMIPAAIMPAAASKSESKPHNTHTSPPHPTPPHTTHSRRQGQTGARSEPHKARRPEGKGRRSGGPPRSVRPLWTAEGGGRGRGDQSSGLGFRRWIDQDRTGQGTSQS